MIWLYKKYEGTERNSELVSLPLIGLEQNPSVCFYFHSTVQNSKHFSPLRSGSERNSEIFLFRGTFGDVEVGVKQCMGFGVDKMGQGGGGGRVEI